MDRYRAAVLRRYGEPFSLEELEPPEIRGEQVLIRTAGCGLCHTDMAIWSGEVEGIPQKMPAVLGHEPSGYVAARGDSVPDHVRVGMPVLVHGGYYVEDDMFTLRGEPQLASKPMQNWTGALGLYGGCFAEYFLVPSYRYLVPAEGLDELDRAAVLTDAALTPYRGVKRTIEAVKTFAEADDFIVVVGVGGLGSFAVQHINILAPHLNIIAVDMKEEALDLAQKVAKIHTAINPSREDPVEAIRRVTGGRKVLAVVDLVGTNDTVSTYVKVLMQKGVYTIIGFMGTQATFSIPDLVIREITIQGNLWGSIAELREVVALAKKNLINYRTPVTRKWRLNEINEAFKTLKQGTYTGRMVVSYI